MLRSGAYSKSNGVLETMKGVRQGRDWFTSDAVGLDVGDIVFYYTPQQRYYFVVVWLLMMLRFHFLLVKQELYIF